MNRLRLVFAGTPEFAVPSLKACQIPDIDIVAVYTQPDRPAGRGRRLLPSPVKQTAVVAGLRVEQPESLRDSDTQARLRELAPDLMVVVAYGLILPEAVLNIPKYGCWNVHASLLPRWRGAAPIQRAICAGDRETGICLMQMQRGLDTGPVLARERVAIAATDTGGSLHDRLSVVGAHVLERVLLRLLHGEPLPGEPQSDVGVTYAKKLEKSEARLDWQLPAIALEQCIRAFNPYPVAQGEIAGETVRIWAAQALTESTSAPPATLLRATRDGIDMATGDGVLRILELQRAGGRRIAARDYLNARPALKTALGVAPVSQL